MILKKALLFLPQKTTSIKPLASRDAWVLWPPIHYDYKYIPTESNTGNVVLAAPYRTLAPNGKDFIDSSWKDGHYLGTDDRGRDVLARLIYGFRISLIFGASLAITGTLIGCLIGGAQGFFGGWVDLAGQRLTEIWGSIPRLYILIILSSFFGSLGANFIFNFESHRMDGDRRLYSRGIFKNSQL